MTFQMLLRRRRAVEKKESNNDTFVTGDSLKGEGPWERNCYRNKILQTSSWFIGNWLFEKCQKCLGNTSKDDERKQI